jgi:anti-anti-sigma regulatory factor
MEDNARQQNATCIQLPHAVTIRNIEAVRSDILASLSTASRIEIDCSDVTEADLSLVQLLVALRKSCARRGSPAALIHSPSDALRNVLHRAGFQSSAQDIGTVGDLFG